MFARHITLTANSVSTVTITDSSSGFEVLNRNGLAEVFVSHDGTATPANPTINGNDFDVIPAAAGAGIRLRRAANTTMVIKLISAAATTVSVRGVE